MAEGQPGLDPDALHEKYLAERDKRLRPEALDQYVRVAGTFAEFAEDPWVEPGFAREPLTDEVDVVVLGGGFSGLLAAVRLRQQGVSRIRVIEKGGDFGGAWYWNRYPGIRCDVESYIYMPLLEETGYIPTEKYARGPEILEHIRRIARHYDLYEDACLQTQVTALQWDARIDRWIVRTNRGDTMRAQFVVLGGAGLHRPKLPGIPGIEEFQGRMFHTSRWDFDYTGGDSTGNLTRLTDKRVAVVGTGATGIQVVPNVARFAEHLYVVQRTPSSVDVRNNHPTDPAWAASLEPGWQGRRMANFTALLSGVPQEIDLVNDAWTDIARRISLFSAGSVGATAEDMQLADYRKMEELRGRIDSVVDDRATAEALKPWYNYACKRPCFSDEYLPAFNQPNVTLLDTDGRGPDQITETGLVVGGVEYDVDCIIFATGFDSFLPVYETAEIDLIGRDGVALPVSWADGVHSVHGICVSGFPNMFLTGNKVHAASTANAPHMTDEQSKHVALVIAECLRRGIQTMEVRESAEARWADVIAGKRIDKEAFFKECTPGYYNFEGAKDRPSILAEAYGGGPFAFVDECAQWRSQSFDLDVELTYPPAR